STGPKVSHNSNHADSSRSRRRRTKVVVRVFIIGGFAERRGLWACWGPNRGRFRQIPGGRSEFLSAFSVRGRSTRTGRKPAVFGPQNGGNPGVRRAFVSTRVFLLRRQTRLPCAFVRER